MRETADAGACGPSVPGAGTDCPAIQSRMDLEYVCTPYTEQRDSPIELLQELPSLDLLVMGGLDVTAFAMEADTASFAVD